MELLLSIMGITLIAAGIISLAFALIKRQAYFSLRDGSIDLYRKLHKQMIAFFAAGGVFIAAGAICVII